MKFFHGTSKECAENIIKNGWNSKRKFAQTWNCSSSNLVYLVSSRKEDCVRFAVEAGQITAAKNGSDSNDIYVFEFDIPFDIADEYLTSDMSCPNMDHCFQISAHSLQNFVANGGIKMSYEVYPVYMPMFRPFYLAALNEQYMKIEDKELKEAVAIAKAINNGSYFFEEANGIMYDYIPYEVDDNYDDFGEEVQNY